MSIPTYNILVIEDDDGFFFLLEKVLQRITETSFKIERESTLTDGCTNLKNKNYSVALLDLTLPDAEREETLNRIKPFTSRCPIIVLTAMSDKEMGLTALRYGIEDYLVKDTLNEDTLSRSIRYSIERTKLRQTIADMQMKQELESISKISETDDPEIPHDSLEELQIRDLQLFDNSTQEYSNILNMALNQRIHGKNQELPTAILSLATTLAQHKSAPRDLIKIHSLALKKTLADCPQAKKQAYMEESRLISLELMGHLAQNYRKHAYFAKENFYRS